MCKHIHQHLAAGKPAAISRLVIRRLEIPNQDLDSDGETADYAATSTSGLTNGNPYLEATRAIASSQGVDMVVLCAELEQELLDMEPAERAEYLELSGVIDSGLSQVSGRASIRTGEFFTFNEKQARPGMLSAARRHRAAGTITPIGPALSRLGHPRDIFEKGKQHGRQAAGVMPWKARNAGFRMGMICFRFNVCGEVQRQMFRPLTLLGIILIALAVFSFLLIPGWRDSPVSMILLVVCLALGGYALIKDALDLWKEVKKRQEQADRDQGKDR
jgi:hypothetical protein